MFMMALCPVMMLMIITLRAIMHQASNHHHRTAPAVACWLLLLGPIKGRLMINTTLISKLLCIVFITLINLNFNPRTARCISYSTPIHNCSLQCLPSRICVMYHAVIADTARTRIRIDHRHHVASGWAPRLDRATGTAGQRQR